MLLVLLVFLCLSCLAEVPALEKQALEDIYTKCGGHRWFHQSGWMQVSRFEQCAVFNY